MDPKASSMAEMPEACEGAANPALHYMEMHGVASTMGGQPSLVWEKQIGWQFTDFGAVNLCERLPYRLAPDILKL
ncbi:hypothetical protein V6N12_061435 [Hibiscus sabdariffa]|uniref:Uncharacterized protein n=1 Tax=Hibiscus sabdariffa TaxID=183260 RepID=A0ABR2DX16_9ROSI